MKKILKIASAIGTTAAVALPIAAVISCGSTSSKNKVNGNEQRAGVGSTIKYADDVTVSGSPKVIDKTFGDGGFANPTTTYEMEPRNMEEHRMRMITGQPYAMHYHLDDLAAWKPGSDADDAYNIATIPLKDRVLAGKILASQKDKELQILGNLVKDTTGTKLGTTPRLYSNAKIFQMWSQVHSFVGWGGSAGEGNFLAPKGEDINAAHRNGVPLLGTMFFAPNGNGGDPTYYDQMTKKNKDGSFPVADGMVAMAKHFGFDGWFLNWETDLDVSSNADVKGFLKYLYTKMKEAKLFTILYDVKVGQSFMQDPGDFNFDEVAADYSHWEDAYQKNHNYAIDAKDPRMSYGYDFARMAVGIDNTAPGSDFRDKNVWLYTYFLQHEILDGDELDQKVFSDVNGTRDPRAKGQLAQWKGISRFFQANTTIDSRDMFSTSFELGIGSKFYIKGEEQPLGTELTKDGYRNQGIQDILPTYTWINDEYSSSTKFDDSTRTSTPGEAINKDGATWKVVMDETGTPYYGGTNLHYTGDLASGSTMVNRLYASKVPLKAGDKFTTVVEGNDAETDLALWTQDNYDSDVVLDHVSRLIKGDSTEDLGNGLSRITYTIPKDLEGKTMASFGLAFENTSGATKNVNYHIGQLSYIPVDQKAKEENKVVSINQDGNFLFMNEGNVRINWKMQDASKVDHYVIWSTNNKSKDDFSKKDILTVTSLPAAFLQNVDKKQSLKIVIDAIGTDDEIISSNKAAIQTTFQPMNDLSKWKVDFDRKTVLGTPFVLKTGHGYTTTFKDSEGNLFIGDDFTRIFKIGSNGEFQTTDDNEWGKSISTDFTGKKTLKIFDYDDKNIGVITDDGVIHVLDKETGKQEAKKITSLAEYIKTKGSTKLEKIDSFIFDKGKILINASGDNGLSIHGNISADGTETDINMQSGASEVHVISVNKNNDGSVTLAYKQDGKIGIKEFASFADIDYSSLSATSEVTEGFKTFIKSDEFKNDLGSDFYDAPTDAQLDKMASGDIKLVQKLASGKTLLVNAWGLAMLLDSTGKKVTVTSLVDQYAWKQFGIAPDVPSITPGNPRRGVDTLANCLDKTNGIIKGFVSFDEKFNRLTSVANGKAIYDKFGDGKLSEKFRINDLSKLINGEEASYAPLLLDKSLSDADTQKIGDVTFVQNVGNVIVVGGTESKIAVFNKVMKQLTLGEKTYSYDGTSVESLQRIYDDNDQTIPEELME